MRSKMSFRYLGVRVDGGDVCYLTRPFAKHREEVLGPVAGAHAAVHLHSDPLARRAWDARVVFADGRYRITNFGSNALSARPGIEEKMARRGAAKFNLVANKAEVKV